MTTEHEHHVSVTVFCGWEFNRICLDIKDGDTLLPIDIKLEDAKALRDGLIAAITQYESLKKSCEEYFAREKEDEERNL